MSKTLRLIKKYWLLFFVLVTFIAWFIYSYLSEGVFYLLSVSDLDSIVSFIQSFGFLAILIFVLFVMLEVVVAPVPPLVLYIAGGIIFGAFWGGTLTLIGNILGAFVAFIIARKYGRNLIESKVPEKTRKKFDDFSIKYGAFSLFILRLNPLTTSDLFSYIAGLTKMKVRQFLFSTALGLAPLIYIQTYIGGFFIKDNPLLLALFILVNLIYLILFLYGLIYLFLKKRRIRKMEKSKLKKA